LTTYCELGNKIRILYSGIKVCVVRSKPIDVSESHVTSIFRVEEKTKQEAITLYNSSCEKLQILKDDD
jgi:hypothetical protein